MSTRKPKPKPRREGVGIYIHNEPLPIKALTDDLLRLMKSGNSDNVVIAAFQTIIKLNERPINNTISGCTINGPY